MSTDTERENVTVRLDPPARIGGKQIDTIALRAFTAGELVGLDLTDLARLSVTEVAKIAPRISNPALTAEEVCSLAPHNYLALAGAVAGFFTPPESRKATAQEAGKVPVEAVAAPVETAAATSRP